MLYITAYPQDTPVDATGKILADYPPPDKADLDELVKAIGAAVAAWQLVEFRLVILFDICTESLNTTATSAAFHEVTGFHTKLKMVNRAVAESRLDERGKADWKKLSEKVRKKSLRRNDLAHGVVTYEPSAKGRQKRLYVGQSPLNVNKFTDGEAPKIITLRDLGDMQNAFLQRARDVHNYQMAARQALMPLARRPQPKTSR